MSKFSCFNPVLLSIDKYKKMPVPCGKCVYCKTRKVNSWAFRIAEEEKYSFSAYFLTLTFDDEYLTSSENGLMTLEKRSFQLFMKRLRKYEETKGNKNKITYYMCGEYGSQTERPHYHVLIFNASEKGINYAWKDPINNKEIGFIYWGNVTEASAKYVVKYMSKIHKIPMFKDDDRLKEFSLMSKGIGKQYIDKMKEWHKKDIVNRAYCNTKGGHKIPMPRYYRDKIYNTEDKIELNQKHHRELLENYKEFEELYQLGYPVLTHRKQAEEEITYIHNLKMSKRN